MRKKEFIWIGVLVVMVAIYIHFFAHWFDQGEIGITTTVRPNRRAADETLIVFSLNHEYKLTSLKVVPLNEGKFDAGTPPVWHLVSDSNSVPTKVIRYGQNIRGMKSDLKGARPDELTPGVVYRLIVSTGNLTGYKDFRP